MKKKILFITLLGVSSICQAIERQDTLTLREVTIVSLVRNSIGLGNTVKIEEIKETSHGQEPSYILSKTPGIFSYGDNGTEFGYGYFRLRGMDQSRINVTLDGLPVFQEIEDHGTYFANTPDLLSSMSSIKVERGSGVTGYGTSSYAGSVSLESIDPRNKDVYFDMGYGNFNTYRALGSYTSGLLCNDKLAFHVRGSFSGTDGYKEHSYNKSQAGVFKLGYYPHKNHSIDILSINGYHRNGQGYLGISEKVTLNPFKQIPNGCSITETDDFFLTINKVQYKGIITENSTLIGSLYWNHLDGNYRVEYGDLFNYGLLQNMVGGSVYNKTYVKDFSFTTGLNYTHYSRRHTGTKLPPDTIIDSFHGNPGEIEYINVGRKKEFNISERLGYSKGPFFIQLEMQYRNTSLDYDVVKEACPGDVPNNHKWEFFNTGLTATYSPKDNQKLYISFANVGREPGRTDIFGGEYFTGEYAIEDPNCKEEVQDIELGYEYFTKLLKFNVNLYYMNFNNELVSTGSLSPQNGLPLHEPIGGYRAGIELWAYVNPWRTLGIETNMALSRNKMKGGYHTHPYSPTFITYSEVSYKWKKVRASLGVSYRSSMYVDLENRFALRPMFNLSGSVKYQVLKNLELGLNLGNITNRFNASNGYVEDGRLYYLIDSPFNMFFNMRITL